MSHSSIFSCTPARAWVSLMQDRFTWWSCQSAKLLPRKTKLQQIPQRKETKRETSSRQMSRLRTRSKYTLWRATTKSWWTFSMCSTKTIRPWRWRSWGTCAHNKSSKPKRKLRETRPKELEATLISSHKKRKSQWGEKKSSSWTSWLMSPLQRSST